jgi:hydroxymethylpyrimidine pyrophosphatase-like HAD family hydrolase
VVEKTMLNRFDKIFLIDINPGNDEITKEIVMGRLSRIVKNASIYQNIVIVSHSNLVLLKKLVSDIGIKIGFIISDNGARVYSITEDRIIFESVIKPEDVLAATHFAIMEGSLVLASGSAREYAYSVNLLNALALNKKHYVPLPYTNDYGKFSKFIISTNIHSILVFQKERKNMLAVNERFSVVVND